MAMLQHCRTYVPRGRAWYGPVAGLFLLTCISQIFFRHVPTSRPVGCSFMPLIRQLAADFNIVIVARGGNPLTIVSRKGTWY